MAYNKVIKRDGTVMLDLTQDTVHESHVKEGITFHDAYGEIKIGTFAPQEKIVTENGDVVPDEGKYLSKVIVNITGGSGGAGGGIIDATELPTENINTEAIYRIAESKDNPPMAYLCHSQFGTITIGQLLQLEVGEEATVVDNVIEVDELSEPLMPLASQGSNGEYIATTYILKSTGVVYFSQDGTLAHSSTIGEFIFGSEEANKGYIDSVDAITESGVYAVRGEVYTVYRYWRYDGSAWSESIPAIEVNELPTEDIQRNTCYILLDTTDGVETKRYFIYKGQWVEYLAPEGEISVDVNGTYDVAKYSTAVVDAAGELQEKTITSNGEFLPDEGYDGFSKVTVGIPFKLQEKTAAFTEEAQTIVADDGYDALSKVDVEAISDEYTLVQGTLTVSANGNYDVANYANAEVAVPNMELALIARTVTAYENEVATTIGNYAFSGCYKLTSVNLPAATTIGEWAFYSFPPLVTISLPAAITIGDKAFWNCTSLTSVNLPAATTIGEWAFKDCTSLTSVNLPMVTVIGVSAFWNCTSLTSVNLSVAPTIGYYTFRDCYNLSSLTLGASTVCTLSHSTAFASTPYAGYSASFSGTPYIYVPASLVDAYKSAKNWSYFASYFSAIEDIPTTES